MILGKVNDRREALVQISILGENQQKKLIAMIDTGFNGDLTLPQAICNELELRVKGVQEVILGDGNVQDFLIAEGHVMWDGEKRRVEINIMETDSLIGMGLLENHRLEIETIPDGIVRIAPLQFPK